MLSSGLDAGGSSFPCAVGSPSFDRSERQRAKSAARHDTMDVGVTLTKSQCARRNSGFVQSPIDSVKADRALVVWSRNEVARVKLED